MARNYLGLVGYDDEAVGNVGVGYDAVDDDDAAVWDIDSDVDSG